MANRRAQSGFSYVFVLAAVVIVGIVVEAAQLTTWRILQADREAELLFRGRAYQAAIKSFYQSNGAFPRSIDDLLKDPGSASRKHIRALYSDPMVKSGKAEWMLIKTADGAISGVSSSSKDEPLKKASFPSGLETFASAKSYSDWVFEYRPTPAVVRSGSAPVSPSGAPPVLKTY